MRDKLLTLFLEINQLHFNFFVTKTDDQNNFNTVYKAYVPIVGFQNNNVTDFEKASSLIKENIYLIEKKFNFTFKEVVLIFENLSFKFLNISGFKALNGSQILRENVIYIINTIKSIVDKNEQKKTIIHIFNSKFILDKKKIENLPIGLFGDLYSHELSFTLIDTNNYKNIHNIFENCNLKIKKIFIQSFIKGAYISDKNSNTDTFFFIEILKNKSKIFFFENNSLKFEQNFNFGSDIIIQDICKITFLKKETVQLILNKIKYNELLGEDLIEENLFIEEDYRKIKKKLIYEIISARIKEFSEIMIFKNINLKYYNTLSNVIFLDINKSSQFKNLKEIYRSEFSLDEKFIIKIFEDKTDDEMFQFTSKLVHYGWKKEAIPVTQSQKSFIARVFETIFG